MHTKIRMRSAVLVASSSLVGMVAGALVLGPHLSMAVQSSSDTTATSQTPSGDEGKYREPLPEEVVAVPPYPVNDKGLTYGSGMAIDADNPGPDLVAAYGVNGEFGYVLATDRGVPATELVTDLPDAVRNSIVPLYASDGETVVGRFHIVPGKLTKGS
jgi:hypothetical protein